MKTEKMSLANIQGKLSRTEMKNVMAGSGSGNCYVWCPNATESKWISDCQRSTAEQSCGGDVTFGSCNCS